MQLANHGIDPVKALEQHNLTSMLHEQRMRVVHSRACILQVLNHVFARTRITARGVDQNPVTFLFRPMLARLLASMKQLYTPAFHQVVEPREGDQTPPGLFSDDEGSVYSGDTPQGTPPPSFSPDPQGKLFRYQLDSIHHKYDWLNSYADTTSEPGCPNDLLFYDPGQFTVEASDQPIKRKYDTNFWIPANIHTGPPVPQSTDSKPGWHKLDLQYVALLSLIGA